MGEVAADRRGYSSRMWTGSRLRLAAAGAPVVALAGLAAALRVPFLDRPLSPDEGGFLVLAGQWSPGSSLYGDYWVDRPPLLIGLFGVADHFGGVVALRVLGIVAVAVAVLLAGALGRVGAPGRRWAPALAAATAAVFLSTPLFGTREVNGELLAAPFVLAGLLAVLLAVGRPAGDGVAGHRAWWVVAGVLAVCAVSVKQSMGDVVVAGVAALVWQARERGVRRAAYDALAAAAGGLVALAAVVGWAAGRGTDPGELWAAVVRFRFEAAAVISTDEPTATGRRLDTMLRALAWSGAPVLLAVPVLRSPGARLRGPLPAVAAAVLAWEAVGIAGGGSYWWHYLIGLVPGLVLLVVAVARHRPGLQAVVAVVLAYAAWSGLTFGRDHPGLNQEQQENVDAAAYLAEHARPGDTGVVAYGVPSILQKAGVRSPYPYLWSLPVRVRDPDLVRLAGVMRGPDRPTWLVVSGPNLDTWAVDAGRAQQELDTRYRLVGSVGRWRFFHVVQGHGTLTR